MSNKTNSIVATMGIDIGTNSFHVVGFDQRGAIVLRQKWSRGQIEARLAKAFSHDQGQEPTSRRPTKQPPVGVALQDDGREPPQVVDTLRGYVRDADALPDHAGAGLL
jgi:hypothetical protein